MSQDSKAPEASEKPKEIKKMSRRQFLAGTVGGVVVGAAVGAAAGSFGFPTIPTSVYEPWLPAKWDYAADVVILGSGFAGLSAAISAHDAGADVLILEKLDQAHEGGSSKVTGGGIWAPADATSGAATIKASEAGQLTDDTIIGALAQGLLDNVTAVQQMGGSLVPLEKTSTGTIYVLSVNGKNALGGGLLYGFFRAAASTRNINVMYSTPATGLIQDGDTKEILGVAATSGGSTINVKANKAVVLACGGFDFNPDMQSQYLVGYPVRGWGGIGNTGDGIQMAQKAGADLWHMAHPASVSAGAAIVVPDYPYPMGSPLGSAIGDNYIWVDRQGNRFVDETIGAEAFEYMMQFDQTDQVFSRIPTWVVFDDTARAKGPFVAPGLVFDWFLTYSGYTWSSDNSAEIAKGWITKADSIADLAASIAGDPDNQNSQGMPMMTAATLEAAVARFNGFAASGTDSDFGRPAVSMAAIQTAPFYAVKTWPSMECSKGGPRRNANCQVVDPSGNPIPRLYSAGMCGSFWGSAGIGGGNIAEALWTGRTAGTQAAGLASSS